MTSRAALLLAAVAALAGCSIDLEGAACEVPGATEQCPDGQRCGKDLRCSKRAAEDSCAFCDLDAKACQAGNALGTCVAVDDACNGWSTTACAAGLVCPSGEVACQCAQPTTEVAVDPERSHVGIDATVVPTGAAEPPGCRLATLEQGLGAGAATVRVFKKDSGTVVFERSSTLTIPDGKTVTTDDPDASLFEIRAKADMPADSDVVRLRAGATLEHFTVSTAKDLGLGDGVEVECSTDEKAVLAGVRVVGASWLRRGLVVTGSCHAEATDLVVTGAKAEGVFIETESAADPRPATTLSGGEIADNGGTGLAVYAGTVLAQSEALSRLMIEGNGGYGVLVTSGETSVDVALGHADVTGNAWTGIAVLEAKRLGNEASVSIEDVAVYGNRGETANSQYGPSGARTAGGILLRGLAPSFTFKSNVVCNNARDEVGVQSDEAWSFSGDACGASSNTFAVRGSGTDYFLYSTSAGSNLTASYDYWDVSSPTDYLRGVTWNAGAFCGAPASLPAVCD